MASANLTITGTTGPDVDLAAKVFPNVSKLTFDLARSVINVEQINPSKITDFDYAITATVTYTISGSLATITIS